MKKIKFRFELRTARRPMSSLVAALESFLDDLMLARIEDLIEHSAVLRNSRNQVPLLK